MEESYFYLGFTAMQFCLLLVGIEKSFFYQYEESDGVLIQAF